MQANVNVSFRFLIVYLSHRRLSPEYGMRLWSSSAGILTYRLATNVFPIISVTYMFAP